MNKGVKDVNSIQPLKDTNRLPWIDAARGIAIFGIFMVNMPAFNAPYFMYGGEQKYWPSETSNMIQTIIDIFFQASFYTLFSFLFGFGLYMMKERLQEKGYHYRPVLLRRLIVLIAFGAIHAFFIWHGDILFSYGTLGLFLFLFFGRSPKAVLSWAIGLLTLSVVILYLRISPYIGMGVLGGYVNEPAIAQAKQAYGEGSLMEIWEQNLNDWLYSNGSLMSWIFLAGSLIPMFLFGLYFAKKKWLHDPDQFGKPLTVTWGITLALFVVFKAGPHFFEIPEWFKIVTQDSIGGSASALFYMTSVVLLYKKRSTFTTLLKPFTFVGRLSLSNYLLQSIICFFMFYSVGLGFYGEVSPLATLILVLVIYSLQVIASRLWIRSFRYGPFEWLWRSLTYMSLQPMRRSKEREGKASYET
ncbi:DUF418 domain-containing protein [Pontibacillus marinus]|nr:DUF418 domain-containing protein [Pontibacillus marinus]